MMAVRLPAVSGQNPLHDTDEESQENKTSFLSNSNSMISRDGDESLLEPNRINNLWIIPHENDGALNSSEVRSSNRNGRETPGSLFVIKANDAKFDVDIVQRVSSPTLVTYKNFQNRPYSSEANFGQNTTNSVKESEVEESEDDSYEELFQSNNQMVFFRYDDKFSRKIYDFNSRPDMVVGLQSYARRYLAKRRIFQKRAQEEAVLIIQSNIELYHDPWIQLYKTIRPLLKFHKADRYVERLKGKIQILKGTLKALKMENSSFTEKLNNLTQKLMRAHGDDERQIIQKNLNELNQEILLNSNSFGNILEKNNRKLDEYCMNDFPSFGINDDSENELVMEENTFASETDTYSISQEVGADSGIMLRKKKFNSTSYNMTSPTPKEPRAASLDKARDDAEFYRMQVELLREEAECQHQSANTHYEEKIIVLSQRIEQLQNQLTEEINKSYKLKKDLDESLQIANDSKLCEKSLQSIIEKLCKQLEEYRDIPRDMSENSEGKEVLDTETYRKLICCKEYVENLRSYFTLNPRALQNTVLEPGGTFDIFEDRFLINKSVIATQQSTSNKKNRPNNLPELATPTGQYNNLLSPMIVTDLNLQRKLEEEIMNYSKRLELELEEKDSMEIELNELRKKLSSSKKEYKSLQQENYDKIEELKRKHQKRINELEEQIEEELRLRQNAEHHTKAIEKQLNSMKRASEYSELEHANDERQEIERRLKEDVIYYKSSLDRVQEEFEDFKTRNDPHHFRIEIDERDEKIALLTHEKSQFLRENEIITIKFQTTNELLEESENRMRQMNKERTILLSRMSQLESERDSAIKEAALLAGKAGADKETVAARTREIDELKSERDILRRELNEIKKEMNVIKFESNTEIQSVNMKMKNSEKDFILMKNYYDKEIEKKSFELQTMQAELEVVLANEKHQKSSIRNLKRQVADLEDQNSRNQKKISDLERNYRDAAEERDRAKSDFTAARETAEFLRASRTRLDEEVNDSIGEADGIIYRRLFSRTPTVISSSDPFITTLKRKSMVNTLPDDADLSTPVPDRSLIPDFSNH